MLRAVFSYVLSARKSIENMCETLKKSFPKWSRWLVPPTPGYPCMSIFENQLRVLQAVFSYVLSARKSIENIVGDV